MEGDVEFFVAGIPRAKQSFRVTGRGRGMTRALVSEWQVKIQEQAMKWRSNSGHQLNSKKRYQVSLMFGLPGSKRADVDNLAKAVLDACKGHVWEDDNQVVTLIVSKAQINEKQLQPGVNIRIREVTGFNGRYLETLIPGWPECHQ